MLRELVEKAVNSRMHLMRTGKSGRKSLDMATAVTKFKNHLNMFPKLPDNVMRDFVKRNWDDFLKIVPQTKGGKSIQEKVYAQTFEA